MNLRLKQLQSVVADVVKEEKAMKLFVEELRRNLGPGIMVSNKLKEIAIAANEQLDIMEAHGRPVDRNFFKTSIVLEAANSPLSPVRKLAARLLPTKLSSKLVFDPASSVRCAAAQRAPVKLVSEASRRFPGDYQLQSIAESRIHEAGLPAPMVSEEFDMYGEKSINPVVKGYDQHKGDDFPASWYERMAKKLCQNFGGNLEGNWEEKAVTNFCSHSYATNRTVIDRDKLLQAVYDCIEERENLLVKESHGASLTAHLSEELMNEAFMPIIEEKQDPIADLLEGGFSGAEYVKRTEELMKIKKSYLPPGIKKYRLGEGRRDEVLIPVNGRVPGGFNAKSERALDQYVDAWNKQQALRGEPYQLSWSPHPVSIDMVGFNLQLK